MTGRPRFVLTVEVCPDRRLPPEEPDAPAAVTLRRAVKQLWRCFRIKALKVEELLDAGGGASDAHR